MTSAPSLVLALLLASTYAVAFHLWRGRPLRYLLGFWIAGFLGFVCGHVIGDMLDVIPWTIGPLRVIEGTVMSILFLAVLTWLIREPKKS
jgi:uncharacterized membrane-anchored protein